MSSFEQAIRGLEHAMAQSTQHAMWSWLLGHRLATVADSLAREETGVADGWLGPRENALVVQRDRLLGRISDLCRLLGEDPHLAAGQVPQLLLDLDRYRQRRNDLVYDSVTLELGGSE